MKIYILRHGEAVTKAASDFDRELTGNGIRDAVNVGLFCRKNSISFTHLLVSPLVRAKQTAASVLSSLPPLPMEEAEFLTPESDPRNLFTHLRSFTNESRVLCVTHEPFAGTCISVLINGSPSSRVVMKPASIACVETDGVPAPGNGKLHWLMTAELIRSIL